MGSNGAAASRNAESPAADDRVPGVCANVASCFSPQTGGKTAKTVPGLQKLSPPLLPAEKLATGLGETVPTPFARGVGKAPTATVAPAPSLARRRSVFH